MSRRRLIFWKLVRYYFDVNGDMGESGAKEKETEFSIWVFVYARYGAPSDLISEFFVASISEKNTGCVPSLKLKVMVNLSSYR